ncbi:MAG: hypothetical protein WBL05_01725 [Brooklawnia sp.]|uniref:hypothetical protein n=1 Tax=Brooklawnia sp. TaxID=2699740 RepID=UPI003C70B46F
MSDPAELNRVLEDLASGNISAARAAELIPDLNARAGGRRLDPEALYDTPPARAMREDEPAEPEPATPPVYGQPVYGSEPSDQAGVGEQAPVGEPTADASGEEGAETTESGRTAEDDFVMFSLQMGDVAATAGEVLKEAGDFARGAFERLGQFASSVIPDVGPRPAGPSTEPTEQRATPPPTGAHGVERLVLRSVGRRVRLIGDPKVGTIAVDGPHTLRKQGVTLEVTTEGEVGLNFDSFSIVRPPRSVEDLRALGFGKELVVRVNPAIVVDAEVTGSRLATSGVPRLGKIRVSAGGAELEGVVEVSDALVQAGGATISGPISAGRSRVRVESGNLTVRLTPGANVTIRSQVQLGRVSWPGETHGELNEYVVGNGSAQLELSVVMGRAVVRVQD